MPLVSPVTVAEVAGAAAVATTVPSSASTRCPTTSGSGAAAQRTTACRSPGVAPTPVGAAGGVRSVGVAVTGGAEAAEALPCPSTATSVYAYGVSLTSPRSTNEVPGTSPTRTPSRSTR
jgi:hypothetical protein